MERLEGVVQPYAWGDRETIAGLQGRPPPDGPEAELWFGAHASAPSRLLDSDRLLTEVVAAEAEATLGPAVLQRFGQFPYLLKVLAAAEPLLRQARALDVPAELLLQDDQRLPPGVPLTAPSWGERDGWLLFDGAPTGVELRSQALGAVPLELVHVVGADSPAAALSELARTPIQA